MSDQSNDDQAERQTFMLLPPNTTIFEPNDIHEVVVQFPDAESAIVYFEYLRQICIDTERDGYSNA